MAWELFPISIGGRYTGALPYNDFPEDYNYQAWIQQGTGPVWSGIFTWNNKATSAIMPFNWDNTADIYPVDYFILEFTDENENVTQFKITGIDAYTTWAYTSTDGGGTWVPVDNASHVNYSAQRYGIMIREIDNILYLGIMGLNNNEPANSGSGLFFNLAMLAESYGEMTGEEISPEYGDASGPGGYDGGTFDDSSDTIGIPSMPSIGVSSIGFVNVYNPSTGALAQLGEDLFPDFTPTTPYTPTGNTVIDAITDVAEALANIATNIPNMIEMYNNAQLINYIIDCHVIPCAPTVGSSQSIKIGYRTMNQVAPKVSSDYVDVDCGCINIGEYYRNFIDYAPYTTAKLFLPFVGFVPIEPELFQSGTLKVVYRFNVIDGSFMAFVLSTSSKSKLKDTVIGQWGGNACVHVPITGVNYSNMVSGIAAGASAVVAEIGKGSLIGAADAALNTAAAAPALQSSNGYNATTSFLSVRTPYLMIERSVSHYSKNYGHEQGYPASITTKLSKITGYTEADSIHLEGIGATDTELKEIAALLAAGVVL